MPENHTAIAIVALALLGIVGLIGLFIFASRSWSQSPPEGNSGVMIVEPTEKGGWIIVRANSLQQAGFKQVTPSG